MLGEQRSPDSTYAIVAEGFDADSAADWDLELLERAPETR